MSEVFQEDASQEQSQDANSTAQQIPDKVQIDGEEIDVRQAIADHKNKKDWQKSQTQRDQEIAEQRKEVNDLLNKFFSSELDASEKVQLDAIINHLLSVQILYKIFIIEDIPDKAQKMADNLGWKV